MRDGITRRILGNRAPGAGSRQMKMSIAGRLSISFTALALATALAGGAGIATTLVLANAGMDIGVRQAPLGDAAMEIKLTGTEAKLAFEHASETGDAAEFVQGFKHLDGAVFYAKAIVDGGTNDEGTFYATQDSSVRTEIATVQRELETYRAAAKKLAELAKVHAGVGSGVDQSFDATYEKALAKIDGANDELLHASRENVVSALHAIGKARFLLANGHLYLEEHLGGDASVQVADILANFSEAQELLARIPLATAHESAAAAAEIKDLAQTRIDSEAQKASEKAAVEAEFNKSFDAFYSAADAAETRIQAAMDSTTSEFAATRTTAVAIVVAITLGAFVIALLQFRSLRNAISLRVKRIAETMQTLSGGGRVDAIPSAGDQDEIGDMARALQVFERGIAENERLRAEQVEAESRAAAGRKADMQRLADEFQRTVGGIVETVSSASGQLENSALVLTNNASATQELSGVVAAASEQTSANVQGVAAASEQLAATVTEISRQVHESSTVSSEAVSQAEKTNARVTELAHSAERIGDVVALINTIAGQTNLLALNATIEAARAGEAGKGFAVVAQEVKALAAQTAKATSEISSQIAGMQTATQDAVQAIGEITTTIGKMSTISAAIAAAVEEQGSTTKEISRNVTEAAKGTSEVASNITEVNKGASETGSASSQVLSSAKALSGESQHLKSEVEKFLATVRAA